MNKKKYISIRKISRILSLCFLSVVLLPSCLDDLDTLPLTDNILIPEKAWQDEATYEQALAKVYAGFALSGNAGPNGKDDLSAPDQGEATFIRCYWNLQELTTDEAVVAWSDEGLDGLQFNRWTSSNRFFELIYNRIYLNIAFANEYLRQTTNAKLAERNVSEQKKQEVQTFRAEARALRALNYYFLMDLFANVPFIPEDKDVGFYLPEQKSRKWIFEWIESELLALEAEGKLPPNNRANYGKMNNPAIWMILSKMYLNAEVYINEGRYTDCLTYLNKIIGAGYTIEQTYKNMFGADNDLSTEIIYPIAFDGKNATTYGGTTYLMAAAYGSDMNPGTTFGLNQSWSGIRSTEALSGIFAGNDKRALFWKNGRTQNVEEWSDYKSGWSVTKYTNMKSNGQPGSDNMFPDTDFPLFRLSDAYLMYAEAVLRGGTGGTKPLAVTYINELRNRAGIGTIGNDQLTLPFIIEERARELYWEAHRRTDLIRFDMFTSNYSWPWKNGVQSGTATLDDKYKIFPLPASELSANTTLTQNDGF
jgi:hypothetical protein